MRHLLVTCFLPVMFLVKVSAQSAEDSVKIAVNKLFIAMKASDSSAIKNAFADSAVLQTIIRTAEGNTQVKNESIPDFARSIGKLPKGAADERIQYESIRIDGPLASVWTMYNFYYNGQLNHCGINSFQLVKISNTWKIQYIIDTRKKDGCK